MSPEKDESEDRPGQRTGTATIRHSSSWFQAGVEVTDVVLVYPNRESLDRLLEGKGKLTLGVDTAIAAGPVGGMAAAATDAKLEDPLLLPQPRIFAGVSFDGAVIHADSNSNALFHKSAEDMKAADIVKSRLAELSTAKPAPTPIQLPPVINSVPLPIRP